MALDRRAGEALGLGEGKKILQPDEVHFSKEASLKSRPGLQI